MKKSTKKTLSLRPETLRTLADREVREVVGGRPIQTRVTNCECPPTDFTCAGCTLF
jgi:hypothetical protein